MEIKYFGHSSFLIKSKEAKLVTDPFNEKMVGLPFPKIEADIVTVSHNHADHSQVDNISGNPLVIDWPGQFEKKGIRIFGFQSFHDKTQGSERGENILYKFESEGISVLHCGDLGVIPEESFLETIGEIDILLVPVGGIYTIDSEEAFQLVKKVEPAIVIPMHYGSGKLAPVSDFTKKFGLDNLVPLPKLVYKKEEIEQEMKVVVLEI